MLTPHADRLRPPMARRSSEFHEGSSTAPGSLPDTPADPQHDVEDGFFDAVFITGGLHHVHPNVAGAMAEIHRILKPGGWLCFYEPHTGSMADLVRRLWYRVDHLFEE